MSRKRARFGTNLDLCERKKSCSGGRSFGGETGLSDDDGITKDGGSDGEVNGARDDSTEEDDEEEGDELDMVVAALVSGRAEQDSDDSDGDAEGAGMPGEQEGIRGLEMTSAVLDVSGDIARQSGAAPRLEQRCATAADQRRRSPEAEVEPSMIPELSDQRGAGIPADFASFVSVSCLRPLSVASSFSYLFLLRPMPQGTQGIESWPFMLTV